MRDSSSTDCISSEEASSNNEYYMTPKKLLLISKRSENKLESARKSNKTSSIPNKIVSKIRSENEKLSNKKNPKSPLSSNKLIQNKPKMSSDYILNLHRLSDRTNIVSPSFTERNFFKNENKNLNTQEINNKNEFIQKQNLRNKLEENILSLIKENSKKTQQIDIIRDSISSNYNEYKKIDLILQRLLIQRNSINDEIQKIKEELIKLNKELLKELNEFLINKVSSEKEEKKVMEIRKNIKDTKADIEEIEKEKKAIKEELFFLKKEMDKLKLGKIQDR